MIFFLIYLKNNFSSTNSVCYASTKSNSCCFFCSNCPKIGNLDFFFVFSKKNNKLKGYALFFQKRKNDIFPFFS